MTQDELSKDGGTVRALDGLRDNFPFPSIRPAQEQALRVIADAYVSGTPFVAIEAPTGAGKSGIGMAPARWSATSGGGGAHYLTSQNSLSSQLLQDFGEHGLVQIRGKANYSCANHRPLNCADGSLVNGGKSCEGCPYRSAKNRYVAGDLGVTNYTYYLTETMYSKELTPREYLICDEAHNIEREILSLVNVEITQNRCNDIGVGRLPFFEPNQDNKVRQWLNLNFISALRQQIGELELQAASIQDSGDRVPPSLQKKIGGMKQLSGNLLQYLDADEPSDWMAWSDKRDGFPLCIKPLTAANFAQKYLFADTPNVLMMSATLLDFATFRRNLGIRKSDMAQFAVPSDFPLNNRRIVFWPVGSMGSKNIEATLPRVAERTAALLKKYEDKKGIIHTHSYKINSFLRDALGKTEHGYRLVTHGSLPGSREDAIAQHYESEDPTILMSPSMTEGLDLKNDLSRIQIITKVPYPFLDPYNRTRMDRDPKWYQLQTALTLVQATGRSVRSADDYALTVILDADFQRFLSQNQDILPKWWLDSIEFR